MARRMRPVPAYPDEASARSAIWRAARSARSAATSNVGADAKFRTRAARVSNVTSQIELEIAHDRASAGPFRKGRAGTHVLVFPEAWAILEIQTPKRVAFDATRVTLEA